VDRNRAAIADLAGDGIEAHAVPFHEFAAEESEAFDVVCAFQTLEHLPSVSDLIEPAIGCLRPGGRIFLSVPNRERAVREPVEALDLPPHHVSRWHQSQFGVLAERYGLKLFAVEREPPSAATFRALTRAPLRARLTPLLGAHLGDLVARAYGRTKIGPWRQARAARRSEQGRHGLYGHTMLAEVVLESGNPDW
jgi:SAM-dependent methyltransferase